MRRGSFGEILREMQELHDRKSRDYGRTGDPLANVRASAAFGVPPWVGALIRQNDKLVRLQSYRLNGHLANESVRDSLIDNAVYAVIALVLYDEAQEPKPEVSPGYSTRA